MDPNETLRMMRRDIDKLNIARDANPLSAPSREDLEKMAFGLAECTEALDEWLSKGGFLPKAWDRS